MPSNDVLLNYLFSIQIDQVEILRFQEVAGIGTEIATIEHKENNNKGLPVLTMQPGWVKWPPLTCKRGVTGDQEWFNWIKQIQDGKIAQARRNISVVLYNADRTEKIRFNFTNAWISKLTIGALQAGGNQIAIEDAVFAHEGMMIG